MKNLVNEIITFIETLTFDYTVEVRKANSKKVPSYPMITVQETNNATRTHINGQEIYSTLGYQFDIFGKDYNRISSSEICKNIAQKLDSELQNEYGFTRQTIAELPDTKDISVSRITIRYKGILNIQTDYLYR